MCLCFVAMQQDNKFKEAIRYYQPLVQRHAERLLAVTAIVLANLCVSFIMSSQVCLATPVWPITVTADLVAHMTS